MKVKSSLDARPQFPAPGASHDEQRSGRGGRRLALVAVERREQLLEPGAGAAERLFDDVDAGHLPAALRQPSGPNALPVPISRALPNGGSRPSSSPATSPRRVSVKGG
jgi:hypothetical protein